MNCPICGEKTKVIDTRACYNGFSVLRERRCETCHTYFKTEEILMSNADESRERWAKSNRNRKDKQK